MRVTTNLPGSADDLHYISAKKITCLRDRYMKMRNGKKIECLAYLGDKN